MTVARVAVAMLAVVLPLGIPLGTADAHELGLSRGDYVARGAELQITMAFARRDAIALLPALDGDRDAALSESEVAAQGTALAARVLAGVRVTAAEAPCTVQPTGSRLVDEDGLEVRGTAACPAALEGTAVTVGVPLLDELATGHRHLAKLAVGGVVREAMLHRRQATLRASGGASTGGTGAGDGEGAEADAPAVLAFFVIGIEHILFGWDHLVFLVGLVLVAGFGQRRARGIFLAVTAFTLAHSVTLALAVMGLVVPSGRIIEPLIALSVAYVGVENFLVKDPGKRWRVTLPFGLIHGFGFAGALNEIGLPPGKTPAALVLFNVGVEAGQLAILAVLLPIVFFLAKQPAYERWGVKVASGVIVLAGLFWFVERVMG